MKLTVYPISDWVSKTMSEQNLMSVAFPTLDETQIRKLAACSGAVPKRFQDGQTLFAVGDLNINFYIVKSGEVEILDYSGDQPKTVTVHHPGQFTGDISHVTGLPAIVSAVARGDCEVYAFSGDTLRRVLNQCPIISDIILQAFIARRQLLRESPNFTGLRVIGSRYSPDTFRVRDFLSKNRILFTWIDLETDPNVDRLLKQFGVTESDTPVVAFGSMLLLRNPSNREIADAVGIHQPLEDLVYDLVVVGGGPAGLAAAVYGASEGLRTAVLEHTAPGGQAGSSMRIENYLGFPTGLTGSELAGRAILQANKFGVHLVGAYHGGSFELRERLHDRAPGRQRKGDGQVPADRNRCGLPPPRGGGFREIRGNRCLLCRDYCGGPAVQRIAGHRCGRRQFRRPGGRLPFATRS